VYTSLDVLIPELFAKAGYFLKQKPSHIV